MDGDTLIANMLAKDTKMPVMKIITEEDSRLREKSIKVRKVDDELRRLAASMRETMDAAKGVGLAAPQVGILRRIIVVGVPAGMDHEDDPAVDLALVNPEIVRASGRQVGPEGCLSIPNWVGDVPRWMNVTVKARDLDDKEVRIKARGYLARVLQHEIDHLDGVLFVDRIEDRSTMRYITEEEEKESRASSLVAGARARS
ncbi:polypeptide deformylase [Nitrolancea hollandica Lb]|uniref:Peptide deformylase n=2 Tax=Nitrolancea hollandica TaxID=1206749 RepID=I4EGP9_9BACT|nr:polypeptide deformylase [Nitrolancea hollandica Lb]